jgi:hypothetical protein
MDNLFSRKRRKNGSDEITYTLIFVIGIAQHPPV